MRDRIVIPALREENLAKIKEENDKKFECSLAKSERERNSWKGFEKVSWISQRTLFKKAKTQCSIDRKNRFDQANQAEAHRIFKHKISIDRKLD